MAVEWQGDMLVEARQARSPQGPWIDDPEVAHREAEAMRLRARGRTFQEIADELGYANRAAAKNLIDRAYLKIRLPAAEAYRVAMDEQLDELYSATMKVMEAKHLKVVAGSVVFDPTTGGIMEDDRPVLDAVRAALAVLERRAKLHGLDAPTRVQAEVASVRVTVDGAEDV